METPGTKGRSKVPVPGAGCVDLKQLATLLRNEGHRALNGVSAFTLTTSALQQLNTECRRFSLTDDKKAGHTGIDRGEKGDTVTDRRHISTANRHTGKTKLATATATTAATDRQYQVQFITDFMEFTPNLKLTCGSDVLNSPVSIHGFSNLTSLHLQKVPVNLLQGLQNLRHRLVTLTVYKGLDSLKNLLESCGADRSAALSWPQLRCLSLAFNSMSELDDSLRLVPLVEVLDLSHNLLQSCQRFLQYLDQVRHVSLAYNLLTQVPSVSVEARASLTCLVLRRNLLDTIHGLGELSSLQQLDLGENCISIHSHLEPLGSLTRLEQLQLDGNPLSYHRLHRQLTTTYLAPRAANIQFELDKKKLTASEISYFSHIKARRSEPVASHVATKHGRKTGSTRPSVDRLGQDIPAAAVLGDTGRDVQPRSESQAPMPGRKYKPKKIKARHMPILDPGQDGDEVNIDDSSHAQVDVHHLRRQGQGPGILPQELETKMAARREEAMKTQREMEELRKHYGHNWLQAIDDRNIFNKRQAQAAASEPPPLPDNLTDHKNSWTPSPEPGARSNPNVSHVTLAESRTSSIEVEGSGNDAELSDRDADRPGRFEAVASLTGVCADSAKPVMATIAKMAAGLFEEDVDRVAECAPADFRDPDVTRPSPERTPAVAMAALDDAVKARINESTHGSKRTTRHQEETDDTSTQADNKHSGSEVPLRANSTAEDLSISAEASQLSRVLPGREDLISHLEPTQQVSEDIQSSWQSPTILDSTRQSSAATDNFRQSPFLDSTQQPSTVLESSWQWTENLDNTWQSWTTTPTVDDQEVIESMLVTCPMRDNEVIILTITQTYLVEKNFRGKVIDTLELASLNHLEWKRVGKPHIHIDSTRTGAMRGSRTSDGDADSGDSEQMVAGDRRRDKMTRQGQSSTDNMQLELRFDYLRKDRQSRCYLLDIPDGNALVSLLQPYLDVKESQIKAAVKTVIQCLKCSQIVPQTRDPHLANTNIQQHTDPSRESAQLDTQEVCPRCGSSLLIELTSPTPPGRKSTSSTRRARKSSRGLSNRYKNTMKQVFHRFTSQAMHTKTGPVEHLVSAVSSSSLPGQKEIHPNLPDREYLRSTGHQRGTGSDDVAGRDRSSAFRTSASTAAVSIQAGPGSGGDDNLVCEDDYFSAECPSGDVSSVQLAEMTSRLRGVSPRSLPVEHTPALLFPHLETVNLSPTQRDHLGLVTPRPGVKSIVGYPTQPIRIQHGVNSRDFQKTRRGRSPGDDRTRRDDELTASGIPYHQSLTDAATAAVSSGEASPAEADSCETGSDGPGHPHSLESLPAVAGSLGDWTASASRRVQATSNGRQLAEVCAAITAVPSTRGPQLASAVGKKSLTSSSVPKSVSVWGSGETASTDHFGISSPAIIPGHRQLVHPTGVASHSPSPSDNRHHVPPRAADSDTTDATMALATSPRGHGCSYASNDVVASLFDSGEDSKHSDREGDDGGWPWTTSSVPVGRNNRQPSADSNESMSTGPLDSDSPADQMLPSVSRQDTADMSDQAGFSTRLMGEDPAVDTPDKPPDFYHLDHQLTLYLMMSLFGTDELFVCKIQCPIVQYIIKDAYLGMVVVSSHRFYILKFTSQDHSLPPEQWIQCVEIQPIPELRYLDLGLGGQSLRLEFLTDCSSFTLVTGDRRQTRQFVDVLLGHLTSYAVQHGITSHVVVNEATDQSTVNNLDLDVVSKVAPGHRLLHYCLAFVDRGGAGGGGGSASVCGVAGGQGLVPLSLVVTSSDLCLVRTNHQWPQPRLQAPITMETVGGQFQLLDRQKINNVASLKVCQDTRCKIKLDLFSVAEGQSPSWNITMSSRWSTSDFIDAIMVPWTRQFGVAMDVSYVQLDF